MGHQITDYSFSRSHTCNGLGMNAIFAHIAPGSSVGAGKERHGIFIVKAGAILVVMRKCQIFNGRLFGDEKWRFVEQLMKY